MILHSAITFFVLFLTLTLASALSFPFSIKVPMVNLTPRGFTASYGVKKHNSTIYDHDEVAAMLGVKTCWHVPSFLWRYAWRIQKRLIPILLADPNIKESDNSLQVMWCKAISSVDPSSPVYDNGWMLDMLPSDRGRWFLRILPTWFFPRLHHASIECRTAYLNQCIDQVITQVQQQQQPENDGSRKRIRIVSLGAGYDVRCTRLLNSNNNNSNNNMIQQAWELDLPQVVQGKQRMLARLLERRPNATLPTLLPIDLNDLQSVQQTLMDIMSDDNQDDQDGAGWHTIFVSEGVMIYLQENVPTQLLRLLRDVAAASHASSSSAMASTSVSSSSWSLPSPSSSLVFADRLEHVPRGERQIAQDKLAETGWALTEWCTRPGFARHMGIAHAI